MNVVFHITPNSTGEKRRWDKWTELSEYLVNQGARITVVGSESDREYIDSVLPDAINLAGKTTLDELIALLNGCDLLVCVNSFVMHLGVALGVRMFAIVGATEPKVVLPSGIPYAYSLYAKCISLETVIEGINNIIKEQLHADSFNEG